MTDQVHDYHALMMASPLSSVVSNLADMALDYLDHLARECTRFGDVLRDAPPSAQVPTCPEWTADDLLWHVAGGAFAFWTAVVRLRDIVAVEALPDPERPAGHDALLEFWARSRDDMISGLRGVEDGEPIWTWSADHTAGWIKRRMAHEILIHRVDAELTVGGRSDIPTAFASDGVDEVLRHFFGNVPKWASWDGGAPNGPVGRVVALDTGGEWTFQLGSLSGTDPDGKHYEAEPALALHPASQLPSFTVRAQAADLDLWLWNRPTTGVIEMEGDNNDFQRMVAMITGGI
jgi:uncharacterized protein (TIGR03083 family)